MMRGPFTIRLGIRPGLAALLSAGAVMAANAQGIPGMGKGATNGPVDISADQSEVFNTQRMQVWQGNVEVVQGQDRLRAPKLTVFFNARASGAVKAGGPKTEGAGDFGGIDRMEADGPVYFSSPTQNARGDHGTYNAAADTITITGNVVLVQDKNVVTGERLVVDQKTGHSTLVSGQKAGGGGKRVRGVFYPNQGQPAGTAKHP